MADKRVETAVPVVEEAVVPDPVDLVDQAAAAPAVVEAAVVAAPVEPAEVVVA